MAEFFKCFHLHLFLLIFYLSWEKPVEVEMIVPWFLFNVLIKPGHGNWLNLLTKLRETIDSLNGREALQRYFHKLEYRATTVCEIQQEQKADLAPGDGVLDAHPDLLAWGTGHLSRKCVTVFNHSCCQEMLPKIKLGLGNLEIIC